MSETIAEAGKVGAALGTFLDAAVGVKNLFGGGGKQTPEPMKPMVPQTPAPPVLPVRDDAAALVQREKQLVAQRDKGSRAGTYLTGDGGYGSNSGFN